MDAPIQAGRAACAHAGVRPQAAGCWPSRSKPPGIVQRVRCQQPLWLQAAASPDPRCSKQPAARRHGQCRTCRRCGRRPAWGQSAGRRRRAAGLPAAWTAMLRAASRPWAPGGPPELHAAAIPGRRAPGGRAGAAIAPLVAQELARDVEPHTLAGHRGEARVFHDRLCSRLPHRWVKRASGARPGALVQPGERLLREPMEQSMAPPRPPALPW